MHEDVPFLQQRQKTLVILWPELESPKDRYILQIDVWRSLGQFTLDKLARHCEPSPPLFASTLLAVPLLLMMLQHCFNNVEGLLRRLGRPMLPFDQWNSRTNIIRSTGLSDITILFKG